MEGTEQPGPQPVESELPRELSLLDSTMINVGSMIGSGIFIVPATIALHLHSSLTVILIWTVGGIVSLFGALSVGELGTMMPKAGGQYVYLREAYGPIWGFLYGWAAFACINDLRPLSRILFPDESRGDDLRRNHIHRSSDRD
ncbi:MAG: amino acid permease [Ignavibacteria bacterium]|nr:MAG: amino acid permease [Ignavibacteria bacterium]